MKNCAGNSMGGGAARNVCPQRELDGWGPKPGVSHHLEPDARDTQSTEAAEELERNVSWEQAT